MRSSRKYQEALRWRTLALESDRSRFKSLLWPFQLCHFIVLSSIFLINMIQIDYTYLTRLLWISVTAVNTAFFNDLTSWVILGPLYRWWNWGTEMWRLCSSLVTKLRFQPDSLQSEFEKTESPMLSEAYIMIMSRAREESAGLGT